MVILARTRQELTRPHYRGANAVLSPACFLSTATWIRVVLTLDLALARDVAVRQELALAPGRR
jgi:hypothetical protein